MRKQWAQNTLTLDSLRAIIADGFRDTKMPTTKMLTPYDEDEQAIIDAFDRRHWSEVDISQRDILNSPALHLLGEDWFHFYLPAYMLASLRPEYKMLACNLLDELTPPKDPGYRNGVFEPRMRLLTTEQRATTAAFIKYVVNAYPERLDFDVDENDLITYWNIPVTL